MMSVFCCSPAGDHKGLLRYWIAIHSYWYGVGELAIKLQLKFRPSCEGISGDPKIMAKDVRKRYYCKRRDTHLLSGDWTDGSWCCLLENEIQISLRRAKSICSTN